MDIGFEFYKEFLEKLLGLLRKDFGSDLISLVLYGSVGRGKAKELSDIDLLLILDNPPANYHRRLDRVLKLHRHLEKEEIYKRVKRRLKNDPYLSYIILSKKEAEENRYIFLDMIQDAKILYDRDDFFAKRLKEMESHLRKLGTRRISLEDGTWYWDLKPDLKPGEVFTL